VSDAVEMTEVALLRETLNGYTEAPSKSELALLPKGVMSFKVRGRWYFCDRDGRLCYHPRHALRLGRWYGTATEELRRVTAGKGWRLSVVPHNGEVVVTVYASERCIAARAHPDAETAHQLVTQALRDEELIPPLYTK
jgi:hypothetical protein